ncbi:minor capsid protein [Ammoniphilus oxalaticus]|uniref:Minor capsid protein n=1 Tax=Ammoniphilus oxalaticus TaxID=66863 RepID=A0A419SCW2_9BACL|nr:phage minor capsid protein [Ammoniphilus oxalaticus]RKD20969.1 minor capsid protein [Ammoniphilus oxalaticus]
MDKREQLIEVYEESGYRILELIRRLEDGPTKRNKERILREVQAIISALSSEASEMAAEIISESYKEGSRELVDKLKEEGIDRVNESIQSLIHQEAVQEIVDECFYSILAASDYMSADAKKRIEDVVRTANQRSLIEGVSRRRATKDAVAELSQQQITGMIAKNGARIPADKYMSAVIHYNQRKAHVDGSINQMQQNGIDLVYVNRVGITCDLCAMYQGRVYSISGEDSRFPKLELKPPYHAHCVHSASAWIESYQGEEEIKKMIELSNDPFKDTRTSEQIRRYNELQRSKSRTNVTRKQWIRYKARMPDLPDLRTFASHKARNTQLYKDWMEDFRIIGLEIKERKASN